jgi:hypothetical protein
MIHGSRVALLFAVLLGCTTLGLPRTPARATLTSPTTVRSLSSRLRSFATGNGALQRPIRVRRVHVLQGDERESNMCAHVFVRAARMP